ncbi:MAG: PDZ domain-containing protein [Deltaproteobacteria bacterium]|nr:PDZ domain-containing protein [Deltaproteobacteria bacterium]
MRKYPISLMLAGACMFLLMGCASTKETYQRGWIGGKYLESDTSFLKQIYANYFKTNDGVIPALPEEISQQQTSAVFVSRVYDDTPIMMAGLKEGDLIIGINNEKVENVKELREMVEKSDPGTKIGISIYRNGTIMDLPVIVGKETYQKWHSFELGLRCGTEFDPIPHPEFDIFNMLSYKIIDTRLELQSPEYKYYRDASSKQSNPEHDLKVNCEGWDAWFVIFGFSGNKVILNQEIADS